MFHYPLARVSCRRSRMHGIQWNLAQFWPVIPYSTVFFLLEPVSCRGQRLARSNGKRNRTVELSFTKNITTFAAVVEFLMLQLLAMYCLCVHHTVPGAQDTSTKMYLAYRVLPKNADHFMKNCNGSTHKPAHRKICLTPIMSHCAYTCTCTSGLFFLSNFYFQTHLH